MTTQKLEQRNFVTWGILKYLLVDMCWLMGFARFLHILVGQYTIAFFSDCIVRRLMSSSSSSMMDNSSNATCSTTNFGRGLVETPLGMLHYKYTGSLPTASSSLFHDNDSAAPNNNNKTLLPILCFHMSPRSTDEYTEVMPLLSNPPAWLLPAPACRRHVDARHRRLTEAAFTSSTTAASSRHDRQRQQQRLVVAIDEPGYGDSDNPRRSCTLDDIADAYIHVATHLGIQNFIVAGSLMGCYIALSLASSRQHAKNRVKAIICTNLYYYPHEKHVEAVQQEQEQQQQDQQQQQQQQQQQPQNDQQQQQQQQPFPAIADSWEMYEDGSHLMSLWNQRSSWLNAELNSRVVHDELTYLLKRRRRYAQGGIHIQSGAAFDLARAAQNVTCPVLIVMGAGAMQFFDAIGKCMTSQLELAKQLFPTMPLQVVIGGGDGDGEQTHEGSINLLNQNHQEWTRAVLQFLEDEVEKY